MFLRPQIQCKSLFNNGLRIVSAAQCPQRKNSSQTNFSNSSGQKQTQRKLPSKLAPYVASLTAVGGAYYLFQLYQEYQIKRNLPEYRHEHRRYDLPSYTMKEIRERRDQGRIWTIYGRGVYDLTEYAKRHPGGEETITMAAGVLLEPFFIEYNFHHKPETFELLESMRVGNLVHTHGHHHHYRHRHHHHHHNHHHDHHQQQHEKLDRCTSPKILPKVDPESYRLELELEGKKLKALKLEDLKLYPTHSIVSSIPCKSDDKQNEEINATKVRPTWTGARLRDVLKDLVEDEDLSIYDELEFECLDASKSGNDLYNTRIKLDRVLLPPGEEASPELEVLLAYKMDDAELKPEHGYPIRVVIPQLAGSRNVKWLSKIVLKKTKPSPENVEAK